jgi:hypothetical protein
MMSATILCDSCGQRVPVPEGPARSKMRCPSCGVYCSVPSGLATAAPACPACGERLGVAAGKKYCARCEAARAQPAAVEAKSVAAPPPAAPMAAAPLADADRADAGEDDANYNFASDPQPKEPCEKCSKLLPVGAIVCNHCGYNRETGTTHKRVHEEVDKQWEPDMSLPLRLGLFLAAPAVLGVVLFALVRESPAALATMWLCGTGLLAYALGTYPRLDLVRNKKGRVRITKTWRACFFPLAATEVPWRGYAQVVTGQSHQTGFLDWLIVMSLVPWGIIPAIFWWLYVVKADQFEVILTKDHGCSTLLLYRGRSDAQAQDIADTLRKLTGLP